MGLSPGKHFGGGKVFKGFVVCDNVYCLGCTFEIVSPDGKGLEDGQELFIVCAIVELSWVKRPGMESDGSYSFFDNVRDDCFNCIVRCVRFDHLGK